MFKPILTNIGSRLAGARLPLERPWPMPLLEYLWRAELFTLCGMVPLAAIGLLPLPGDPVGLILRVLVLSVLLVIVLEALRNRIVNQRMSVMSGEVRDIRRQWIGRLADLSQLPADRQAAEREMLRETIQSIEMLEEELALGFKHPFVADLETARAKLTEAAAAMRSTPPDAVSSVA